MKKTWMIVSIVEIFVFVLLSIFIFTRKVDGSGLVQTPEVKMITWYVLDVPFVLLVIVQVVWGIIIKKQR
ncbi:DUF3923 family protein [Levilactobacillus brevis]|jgi:hypothetical protein|uniref:Uncharacterized protein n=2 Tax=Levilactobacillus brevis TaxID=1580 RepID=U2PET9_LEVBR|nr:DUF3923 family protein [Levilactobacillus brevis]ARN92690.1 hypothetical protein AZI11_07160 [Levilactobacillus brevis]ARN95348.1 hypothetical protein AZI12_07210 [Levilactobacillus brevis]ATU69113.1 DUF3923 domain-containing protein [Levilactobacillus brevis]ERK42209.1 hypothetical protein HMPREF0495_01983 [Levilactobacillus brevis ATCC 14869 = DSM 20054]KID44704.1 integral membrane protein [Levilactobacillus brevis]